MSADLNTTEPRVSRAVLGDKTTNAKARHNQTINDKNAAVREIQQSKARPTTVGRNKSQAPKTESSKLQILLDHSDPLSDEPDTNPPPPSEIPYKSDVFPAGVLTFDAIKPDNRLKGYYDYYHNRRDENGMTRVDREMKAAQNRRWRDAEVRIMKDIDDMEWDLGLDSPKKKRVVPLQDTADKNAVRPFTANKTPPTLASRRAASVLGMTSEKPNTTQRKPLSATSAKTSNTARIPSFMRPTKAKQVITAGTNALATHAEAPCAATTSAAALASRSTLGYNKGRTASSVVHSHAQGKAEAPARTIARPITSASDKTATATSYARDTATARPEFVSIFDVLPEEDDAVEVEGDNGDQLFGSTDENGLFGSENVLDLLATGKEDDDAFRFQLDM